MASLLRLRDVGFAVSSPRPQQILANVTLDLDRGVSLAIVGPSGAGKSTLASIVGALLQATTGSYEFSGLEMTELSNAQLARFRSEHLGFVFQHASLIDERTVAANVLLGLVNASMTGLERERSASGALQQVGIAHLADRVARDLSGGERQRVAIARALAKAPDLVIADEPTASLDQTNGQEILNLLRLVTERGATLVTVSHDVRVAKMADETIEIVDGQILAEGDS